MKIQSVQWHCCDSASSFQRVGALAVADISSYWKRICGDQAESFSWDMRRLAPWVMAPAARATDFIPSVMGPTLASSSAALATGLAAPPSHRLLSAIIGQRPRGATAPGHKPLSVVISHRLRDFIGCTGHGPCSAPSHRPLSPIMGREQ